MAGADGAAGAQGVAGPLGLQGPQGNTGVTGAVGPQGLVGALGPQGATGAAGPAGAQGAQGTKGDSGDKGDKGDAGLSIVWRGAWDLNTTYAVNDAVSLNSASYIATAAGSGAQPDSSPSSWNLLASVGATGAVGPQGPAGATGATGAQGVAGPAGPQGAQGNTGAVGPQGPAGATGPAGQQGPGSTGRVYRWNVFDTYDNIYGWILDNDPAYFGGVNPSTWTDSNGTAGQVSPDKEVQRTLFVNKGYPGKNALVFADTRIQYSSTDGKVVAALLRVKNTTAAVIPWTVKFRCSRFGAWSEWASVALNGANVWVDNASNQYAASGAVPLSIPANRTSTLIVIATSGYPVGVADTLMLRATVLAFVGDSLALPAGLEFVDDLETATGGYEQ